MPKDDSKPSIKISELIMHDKLSFFKYVTIETAKITLVNKTLRWSSPLLFDDPYDVTRELAAGIKPSEIQQCVIDTLVELVKKSEEEPPELNPLARQLFDLFKIAKRNNQLDKVIIELRESKEELAAYSPALGELRVMWQQWLPTFRILCLSARNDIALMWSKYAENYKGVVLEFACSEQFKTPQLIAKPVLYEDRPSLLDKAGWGKLLTRRQSDGIQYLFNESCHTKSLDWSYQEEWRVVSFRGPGEIGKYSDYKYYPQTLSAIYFGSEISLPDREALSSLLKDELSHVMVFWGKRTDRQHIKFIS